MLKLEVEHTSRYTYDSAVAWNPHRIFLYPRADGSLRVLDYALECNVPHRIQWGRDVHENVFAEVSFTEQGIELSLAVKTTLQVVERNPFDFVLSERASRYPFPYSVYERNALSAYLHAGVSEDARNVLPWIYKTFPDMPGETLPLLTSLNESIWKQLSYQARDEEGVQSPDETLAKNRGSCRDFAWLFVHACRQMGMAARFVSGYHYNAGGSSQGRTDHNTHAWVEVYLPGSGWRGFDPTNGILTDFHFIPCAVGMEPMAISPVQGSFRAVGQVNSQLEVMLSISGR